jgi:hypothetical protein
MLSWTGTLVTSSFTLKRLHNTVVKFIMFNHQIVKKPANEKKSHQNQQTTLIKKIQIHLKSAYIPIL